MLGIIIILLLILPLRYDIISKRPDLFSMYVCSHLNDLQANTSCFPKWSKLEPILDDHMKKTTKSQNQAKTILIEKENQLPVILGSGCIASVIKAKIMDNNYDTEPESIAIKITHPNVKLCIQQDVKILKFITNTLEYLLPRVRQLSLSERYS